MQSMDVGQQDVALLNPNGTPILWEAQRATIKGTGAVDGNDPHPGPAISSISVRARAIVQVLRDRAEVSAFDKPV